MDTSSTEQDGATRPLDIEAGRRAFMKVAGFGGALAAFAGGMGQAEAQSTSTDLDTNILNFALHLEYLEGEYYNRGVYGQPLPPNLTRGVGIGGAVSGGTKVNFQSPIVLDAMAEVANDEKNHIIFVRSALGSSVCAEPALSLDRAFTAFAAAAGLPGGFNPFADDNSFLLGAYILTEVGVTALNGAAPFITSKAILAAASSIFAAEAYHLGTIRTLLYTSQNVAFNNSATALISAARARLSGMIDDEGIGADQSQLAGGFPSPVNITDTDANSLAWARTPRQVLNVVTGQAGASKGGFFPNGVSVPRQVDQLVAATGG